LTLRPVAVRFGAEQGRYVSERIWHPTQRIRELPDGRIDLSFEAGGTFEIACWTLGWGDAAVVVRPARLREPVRRTLKRATANYQA
jgi:predicted DNA-binding transcriptional regulator YafY